MIENKEKKKIFNYRLERLIAFQLVDTSFVSIQTPHFLLDFPFLYVKYLFPVRTPVENYSNINGSLLLIKKTLDFFFIIIILFPNYELEKP